MRLEINIGVDKARDSYKREKGCEQLRINRFLDITSHKEPLSITKV